MTKTTSAIKRILATVLAVLTIFSGMAVSVSAAGITVPPPEAELITTKVNTGGVEVEHRAIIVTPSTVPGYTVDIEISPNALLDKLIDGTYKYYELTEGTTYVIKAYVIDNGEKVYSSEVSKTLLKSQTTPAEPVPVEITSSSIEIAKVTGCEYMIEKSGSGVSGTWADSVIFEGLTPETRYIISIRKKASATHYSSEIAKINVKTLSLGKPTAAKKPDLVDKTNKTITVKEVDGVKFSIDQGKTWQTSGEFKNLTPDTIYGIIARENFDPNVQDPNPVSEILEVKTNKRVKYDASIGKCTFKLADGTVYANKAIRATVTGDGPKDILAAEYGDTRLIPDRVEIRHSAKDVDKYPLALSGTVYVGNVTPRASLANQKTNMYVVYRVEFFDGKDWVPVEVEVVEGNQVKTENKEVSSSHQVQIGDEYTAFTKVKEFFEKVANLFLNTIPQLIANVMGNDIWDKLFKGVMDLIGGLGKAQ